MNNPGGNDGEGSVWPSELALELGDLVLEVLDTVDRDGKTTHAAAAEMDGTPNQILAAAIVQLIGQRLREHGARVVFEPSGA
jgi:hypothetical protein